MSARASAPRHLRRRTVAQAPKPTPTAAIRERGSTRPKQPSMRKVVRLKLQFYPKSRIASANPLPAPCLSDPITVAVFNIFLSIFMHVQFFYAHGWPTVENHLNNGDDRLLGSSATGRSDNFSHNLSAPKISRATYDICILLKIVGIYPTPSCLSKRPTVGQEQPGERTGATRSPKSTDQSVLSAFWSVVAWSSNVWLSIQIQSGGCK